MTRYRYFFLVFLLFAISLHDACGQKRRSQDLNRRYAAVVTDESGNPVAGALISGREGAVESRTDEEGKFSITVPAGGMLRIDAEGFETELLNLSILSPAIALKKRSFLMGEADVVNLPFREAYRRENNGAVSVINPSRILKYDNVQSFYSLLTGRVSGLLGTGNIRGTGGAVFVVDGLPRDPSNLDAEEIAQVTIVKDPAAAVLYGVHAANGLVLVTTKRGQPYQRRFNVAAETGFSTPVVLPRYLGSADYMRLYNEARANDGLAPAFDEAVIAGYAGGKNPYRFPDVDYFSGEFLSKSRSLTKVVSEFSGGNKATRYYAHVGWINAGSLYRIGEAGNSGDNRFNVRANIDVDITGKIKTWFDAVAVFNIDKSPAGNFWNDAAALHPYRYAPLLPLSLIKHDVSLPDGVSLGNAKLVDNNYILGGTGIFTNNVYGNQYLGGYSTSIQRTAQFNQGLDIDLGDVTRGLNWRTVASLDVRNSYVQSVTNQYAVYEPTWETNAHGADSIAALNKIGTDLRNGVQDLGNLNFDRRFGVQTHLGYARTFREVHSFSGTLLGYFDQFNSEGLLIPSRHAHLGFTAGYDYGKRYFATLAGAYVNGYKLGKGNKGGFSPTFNLGWVISEEDFLPAGRAIGYLKLKVSAGIVNYEAGGSDYRQYDQTFGPYQGSFSWDDGIRSLPTVTLQRAANPGLTFEKMKSVNVGIEGFFFGKSLYADVNMFANRRSGEVVQRTIYPDYLYRNVPYENYGETGYKGIDFSVSWTKSQRDFRFSVGVNGLYAASKVIRKDEIWLYDYLYRTGGPADAIYGLEAIGYFADAGDIANSPGQQFGEVQPGDIKYKDQNSDGKIDANDMVRIGNSLARFSYGVNLLVTCRNISLMAIGNGLAGGNDAYDGSYFWIQGDLKYSSEVLNRWTPQTAGTATYPRLSASNNNNNFRASTHWLYKNNLFNLNRIQLTYQVPHGMAERLFSRDVSVYLRGENLVRISEDAERRQIRAGAEPLFRNFALGVRVKF